jgi:hypothetical protein
MTKNRKQSKRQFIQYIPDISYNEPIVHVPVHMPIYYDISCVPIPIYHHHHHYDISVTIIDISCVQLPIQYNLDISKIDISYTPIHIYYHYDSRVANKTLDISCVTYTKKK